MRSARPEPGEGRPGLLRRLAPLALLAAMALSWTCSPKASEPIILPQGTDGGRADGGVDGGGGGGGLPVKLACGVLTSRRCGMLQRCGLIGPSDQDVRACEAFYTATWCGPTRWSSRVDPSVATLKYDPARAVACADSFLTRDCDDYATLADSCLRFLSPAVSLSHACYGDYEECQAGVCRGVSCPKTCQPRGVAGEVCAVDADCLTDHGFYCRATSTPGVGQCTSVGGLGEACSSSQPCGVGLLCESLKCVVQPTAGEPCVGGRCDDSSWCAASASGGLCEPKRNPGAACTDDVQCLSPNLCETLSGECAPVQLTQAGAPCGPRQVCPTGMSCQGLTSTTAGTCLLLRKTEESCQVSSDCQAHLACAPNDGGLTCQPRGLAGVHCDTGRDCGPFQVCLAQACQPLGAPGGECAATRKCLWGSCADVGDGGFMCADPGGPGTNCAVGSDCASGRCATGLCLASCVP